VVRNELRTPTAKGRLLGAWTNNWTAKQGSRALFYIFAGDGDVRLDEGKSKTCGDSKEDTHVNVEL